MHRLLWKRSRGDGKDAGSHSHLDYLLISSRKRVLLILPVIEFLQVDYKSFLDESHLKVATLYKDLIKTVWSKILPKIYFLVRWGRVLEWQLLPVTLTATIWTT